MLVFVAVMGLYAQWRFASPFLPSPTLKGSAIMRHRPLLLFLAAGVILSVSLRSEPVIFIPALLVGVGFMLVAIALAYSMKS